MSLLRRIVYTATGVAVLGAGAAAPALAQEAAAPQYQQVISANPFGLLLEIFNAEYERVVTESSTAGFGGSYIGAEEDDYLNADVFWRFYPSGTPLDGWSFGAKAGITHVSDVEVLAETSQDGTYFGAGFDVNRSWLLGKNNNFYVGLGFGLKRLFGADEDDFELEVIPTFRIVNVGFAF